MSPTLLDEDLVIWTPLGGRPRFDGLHLVQLGDDSLSLSVKRAQCVGVGRYRIFADNPVFHAFEVCEADWPEPLTIVGRVVGIVKRVWSCSGPAPRCRGRRNFRGGQT
jgi:hypothetical protein